ncbi:hypothetical protein EET67_18640 [Pseudaminobacter arsenicus]|uniref:Uncharacterized protein n=1 Tax=Borborobacter arsenicus TaxID=1851146 RepID=A0A432V2K2_9HYPH|nr:hypothetical protein [Pseudaminobacter arsenicus]RUM96366.1 hypothetical protein EET67_18640 [Pseudaminobacter arsenicus]
MPTPDVDGELCQLEAQPVVKRNTLPIIALLCGSAMVVTVINAIAAIHLYRASQQMDVVETRLEELAAFEKRMKERLDLVNTGLQSQFDQLNQDLQGRFGELHASMERIGQNLDAVGTSTQVSFADTLIGFENASIDPEPGPMVAENEPDGGSLTASGTADTISRRRPAKAMPAISPAYQRKVMPDGKVYYRKVHGAQ